ncbi:MAG: TolC family protein [Blastocatellia bacterium]
MSKFLKTIVAALALSVSVMAQDSEMKTPVTSQDLKTNPLLTPKSRPVPPPPDMTRLGVNANALSLSLNEAIRRALQSNNDIEVARDNVRLAETTLRSLEGVYDPIISLAPQFSQTVTPVANTPGGATASDTISQKLFTFSPFVSKQFSRGGGQYQFFFNNQRLESNSPITTISPYYATNLGVTLTQPLLRDRSIDLYRHDIRIQRKRLSQSDYDFRLSTIAVIAQVQQAYWELVFAQRDQQNQLSNLNLAREQLRMIEERIAVGTSAPLERAQALTQIATSEINLLAAVQYVTTTENALKLLIFGDPATGDWSAPLAPTDQPSNDWMPIDLRAALTDAYANRPELNRLRVQQDINGIDVKFYKNQTLPRIDLQSTVLTTGYAGSVLPAPDTPLSVAGASASPSGNQTLLVSGDPSSNASAFLLAQINQLRAAEGLPAAADPIVARAPGFLTGGYGQALRNLWDFKTRTVALGVTIQFPLRNRTAEANLAGARIQGQQLLATIRSQTQAIEVDVRNAAQTVDIARRQVLSAHTARASAEVQLAGEIRRYQTGLSTTYLVFQYENQLVAARTAELRAEANYNQAIASFQRATSTTLRANNVVIQTPSVK